jgi:UDP-glucose 4-epimerase
MTTSIANPSMDFEVNVMGTHNLREAVRNHAPDATVVYSSTNKVYGDLEQYTYRETAVIQSIENLERDLTVLMIAHRLTTLQCCDTIYRLDQGSIVSAGGYDELFTVPTPSSASRPMWSAP